jgi:hypothetical protein
MMLGEVVAVQRLTGRPAMDLQHLKGVLRAEPAEAFSIPRLASGLTGLPG